MRREVNSKYHTISNKYVNKCYFLPLINFNKSTPRTALNECIPTFSEVSRLSNRLTHIVDNFQGDDFDLTIVATVIVRVISIQYLA